MWWRPSLPRRVSMPQQAQQRTAPAPCTLLHPVRWTCDGLRWYCPLICRLGSVWATRGSRAAAAAASAALGVMRTSATRWGAPLPAEQMCSEGSRLEVPAGRPGWLGWTQLVQQWSAEQGRQPPSIAVPDVRRILCASSTVLIQL